MGGRDRIIIGKKNYVARLDTTTFTNVDVVVLKPLPPFAMASTANVDGNVIIRTGDGTDVPEVSNGNIDLVASIGSFAIDSNNVIRLIFDKGIFPDLESARDTVSEFEIIFQLIKGASFVPNLFLVDVYDKVTGNMFYNSVQLDSEKMLNLINTMVQAANLSPFGMDAFEMVLRPVIRT
jgi:hypothetical protein